MAVTDGDWGFSNDNDPELGPDPYRFSTPQLFLITFLVGVTLASLLSGAWWKLFLIQLLSYAISCVFVLLVNGFSSFKNRYYLMGGLFYCVGIDAIMWPFSQASENLLMVFAFPWLIAISVSLAWLGISLQFYSVRTCSKRSRTNRTVKT